MFYFKCLLLFHVLFLFSKTQSLRGTRPEYSPCVARSSRVSSRSYVQRFLLYEVRASRRVRVRVRCSYAHAARASRPHNKTLGSRMK